MKIKLKKTEKFNTLKQWELIKEQELDAAHAQKEGEKFLGKAKIGDLVYNIGIAGPQKVKLLKIYKSQFGFVHCECLWSNGVIKDYDPRELRVIQTGNACAEFEFPDMPASEIKGDIPLSKDRFEVAYIARLQGFRIESIDKKNGRILYKFYGDNQEELDDFVNTFLRNDLTVY